MDRKRKFSDHRKRAIKEAMKDFIIDGIGTVAVMGLMVGIIISFLTMT